MWVKYFSRFLPLLGARHEFFFFIFLRKSFASKRFIKLVYIPADIMRGRVFKTFIDIPGFAFISDEIFARSFTPFFSCLFAAGSFIFGLDASGRKIYHDSSRSLSQAWKNEKFFRGISRTKLHNKDILFWNYKTLFLGNTYAKVWDRVTQHVARRLRKISFLLRLMKQKL